MQKSVLGKGLTALISGNEDIPKEQASVVSIDEICLNPMQPRKKIEEEKIRELSESIKEHGVLQPVIITKKEGLYHLVVGERRLRAAKAAGLDKIPALVKEYTWDEMLKVALVENLQREDLNAVEEARAYQLLIDEHSLTQEQVAKTISRSRPYVANTVRLLNLPLEVVHDIEVGVLSAGHARALLGLSDNREITAAAALIKKNHLSVRQTEELVKKMKSASPKKKPLKDPLSVFKQVQERLTEKLAAKVAIRKGKGPKGKIEIHFSSEEELNRLVSALGGDEDWMEE